MLPVIAIVGRPNVGKSTLFNRLTRSRDALVADYSGLTRDRQYGEGILGAHRYIVIDTGGIDGDENGVKCAIAAQTVHAISEADAVLFVVDAREGLLPADEAIVAHLRCAHQRIWLVVNKVDTLHTDLAVTEFYRLGLKNQPFPVAAAYGRGVTRLINDVLGTFFFENAENLENSLIDMVEKREEKEENRIKIAIIGRPNVGKSTLVNRILGQERVVVYDQAGTTRDSIYIPYEKHGLGYALIDTAGIRRRSKVEKVVEKFSIIKALQSIERANTVVLVLDATEGLVEQDLHLVRYVLEIGRGIVIAVNKWDSASYEQRRFVRCEMDRRLRFASFITTCFISAKAGTGLSALYHSIKKSYAGSMQRWGAQELTHILEVAVKEHQPPLIRGIRVKLRYCHMGGNNPLKLIIHGNKTSDVPKAYCRYLENKYRSALGLSGTPIHIEFRTSANPFADNKNKLSDRQIKKRQRLMRYVKKKGTK